MKSFKSYEVGNLLWRTTDNALFEITQINIEEPFGYTSTSSYVLKCVNHMDVAERVTDHEPETEFAVNRFSREPTGMISAVRPAVP